MRDELLRLLRSEHIDFDLYYHTMPVHQTVRSGPSPVISIVDNPVAWIRATLSNQPHLLKSKDPFRIVSHGIGLCSDKTIVLNTIAARAGLKTRALSLNGHVVSEIETSPGVWQVADADYGLVFDASLQELSTSHSDLLQVYKNPRVPGMYTSVNDNVSVEGILPLPGIAAWQLEMIDQGVYFLVVALVGALLLKSLIRMRQTALRYRSTS